MQSDHDDKIVLGDVKNTKDTNRELNCFFDRKFKGGGFLGLVWDKHLRFIGKITHIIRWPDYSLSDFPQPSNFPLPSESDLKTINEMIRRYPDYAEGYFFFVDDFLPINGVLNTSPNGIRPAMVRTISKITSRDEIYNDCVELVSALNSVKEYPLGAKE